MSAIPPDADLDQSIQFLDWYRPGGPWVLTAIPPEGGRTYTETLSDPAETRAWLEKYVGRLNLYFMVNPARAAIQSKAKKEDVEELAFLHVDVDPEKRDGLNDAEKVKWIASERARILAKLEDFSPSPSAIIDSGGGFQGFWRLAEGERLYVGGDPNRISDGEAYNRQLEIVLGGDHCWNIDRIMRVPGTINIPDDKKRKRGRVEALAQIVELNGMEYGLADFTPATGVQAIAGGKGNDVALGGIRRISDLDELPAGVSHRMRQVIAEGSDADPERYPSRSEAVCAVLRALVRAGCDDDTMAAVLLEPSLKIGESIREKRNPKAEAAREIANARDDVGELKPRIVYSESELPRVLDEAEAALVASGIPIYQMNGRLVAPVRLDGGVSDEHGVRRAAGSLVISDVRDHRLLEHMIAAARFVKLVPGKDGKLEEKPCAPPLKFAKHYAERAGAWRLPVLDGTSTIPTMRADGSIVSADGYDTASRLLIDTQGVAFPPVPDKPTEQDARAALVALIEPLSEFPFVQDDEDNEPSGDRPSASRSAALAMMLTAVVRKSLSSAPIFGLSAPTMETGKSLLADIPAWMVTGREAAMMSQGATEEEDQKGLLSILMSGDPVNVIDNVTREVTGDALCTILTKETWRQRWLGANRMMTVSTKAVFIANGNNLVFREDMASRAVVVSLDARMERPGEREFQRELKVWVPQHRAELVVAALTLLRAYVVAGTPRPAGMRPTRFADWDLIRRALLWLGEPDPWVTQARVTAGDSARAELVGLMSALRDAFGPCAFVSPREIIERAEEHDRRDQRPSALGVALSVSGSGRGVSPVGLGKYLKSKANRRHEGMWIKAREDPKKGNRYAIMVEEPGSNQPLLC